MGDDVKIDGDGNVVNVGRNNRIGDDGVATVKGEGEPATKSFLIGVLASLVAAVLFAVIVYYAR